MKFEFGQKQLFGGVQSRGIATYHTEDNIQILYLIEGVVSEPLFQSLFQVE